MLGVEQAVKQLPENLAGTLVEFEKRILERLTATGGPAQAIKLPAWLDGIIGMFTKGGDSQSSDPMMKETFELFKTAQNLMWRKMVSDMKRNIGLPEHVTLRENG